MTPLKLGSLFAGYGGLELGVSAALADYGIPTETVWVSDIDKGACKILAHRFPDAPNHGDLTKIDWTAVEPVDVLTGGFPCQDVSTAGKRKGMKPDTRSGLWTHMSYAIATLKPKLVIAENVRGLLSAEAHSDVEPCPWCVGDGSASTMRALGAVLADLADLGYDASWYGLRAADVGACHGRFRVFVVAYPRGEVDGLWAGLRETFTRGLGWGRPDDGSVPGREPGPVKLLSTPDLAPEAPNTGSNSHKAGNTVGLGNQVNTLLPTPDTGESVTGHGRRGGKKGNGHQSGANLEHVASLLPTPQTVNNTSERAQTGRETSGSSRGGPSFGLEDVLLPTPNAALAAGGQTSRSGDRKDEPLLSGIAEAATSGKLLPTPAVNDMGAGKTVEDWDEWTDKMKTAHGNGNGHGASLSIEAARLLPTPNTMDGMGPRSAEALARAKETGGCSNLKDVDPVDFGQYGPAVARWEQVTGNRAPAPTEPTGKGGAERLSAKFTQWMMGLPDGWITDVPDLTRNEALKACGNGVVPQQARAALHVLLPTVGVNP